MTKPQLTKQHYKTIFLSSLGGALEFYDFVIFSFWAKELSDLFFPHEIPLLALINVYMVFAIGYLVRPIGGIVFSHFGDKYGRKKPFIITILFMSFGTLGIGLLPTYQSIGIMAPILLILFRLIQGFCVGGEIPGALTFVSEHVNANRRGLTCALIFFGVNLGLLFGSAFSFLMISLCTPTQVQTWGWRLTFIVGGVLGLVSLYLRKELTESPLFKDSPQKNNVPLLVLMKNFRLETLQGIAITSLDAALICTLFIYLPTYLTSILNYPKDLINEINTFAILINSILFVGLGWLSDYVGRKIILLIGSFSFTFFSIGLFYLLTYQTTFYLLITISAFVCISACISSSYTSAILELFPTRMRYTGMAMSYNIGFAFFGGLAPLISTMLINFTGNNISPSYYLSFIAICCLLAVLGLRNQPRATLDFQ